MNRLKNTHFSSYGSLLPLNKNKKSNYSIEDTNSNTNDNQRARDRDRNSGVKYQRATSLSHSVGHSRGQKSAEAVPVSMHTRNTRDKQTGERIWYESYTTIDWLEDAKKEQDRLKALVINDSSYKKSWDKIEDWGLAAIVGVGCGIFAGVISQTTEYLSSLKVGYCSGDIFLGKEQCERKLIHKNAHSFFNTFFKNDYAKDNGNTRQVEWRSWESVLEPYGFGYYGGFLMFVVIGAVLGWIAAQIVLRNASERRKPSSPTTTANEDSEQRVGLRYSRDEQTEKVYYGVGSGIPEVKSILSGFVIHEFLGLRVLLVKSTGLIFSVASGIMAGREGPMVHIASCIGNICTRLNRKKYDYNESGKRAVISAASAAGVSVAFGAPIGGVLFSLEEVSYFFNHATLLLSYFCALVAALVLRFYDPFRTGKIVMFQVFYNHNYSWVELPFFVLIGIFGGLFGATYIFVNVRINKLRRRLGVLKKYASIEVVAITVLTLAVCYHNPATKLSLGQMVGELFSQCDDDGTGEVAQSVFCVGADHPMNRVVLNLIFALIVRGILAMVTFGIKVPSGLVLPSMSIGALFGRLIGTFVEYAANELGWSVLPQCGDSSGYCVTPGVYALVGAGAALTGVTRGTISVAVILFELTESLTYTLPVMVAIMTSKFVAETLDAQSIYEKTMELNGYPFINARNRYAFTKDTADQLVTANLPCICVDQLNTVASLANLLYSVDMLGYFDGGLALVNSSNELLGSVSCEELKIAIADLSTEVSNPQSAVCNFDTNILSTSFRCKGNNKNEKRSKGKSNENGKGNGKGKGIWGGDDKDNGNGNGNDTDTDKKSPNKSIGIKMNIHDLSYLINKTPITVKDCTPVEIACQLFCRLGISYLCVERQGRYVGIVSKKQFITYLNHLEAAGNVL